MIREIVFVDSEKVGFIEARNVAQGMVLQPKFIHVNDVVVTQSGKWHRVDAISTGEDAGEYGDLCVFKLNDGSPDIIQPFMLNKVYREVTP